jgi:very-short-patch-repair endonuclease
MPTIDVTHPDVAAQWHPTLNGDLKPSDVTAGSNKKVWWKCPKKCPEGCEHVWEAVIGNRCILNRGCPYCAKHKNCIHISIVYTHSEVAAQWHPTLNGDLKPSDVTASSNKKVWWLCPKTCPQGCAHEWETTIAHRCIENTGCPYCSHNPKLLCEHMTLGYTHPQIALEFHPTKNGGIKLTDLTYGSNKIVWWQCKNSCSYGCLHEWKATPLHRCSSDNTSCPYCSIPRKKWCEHSSIVYTHPLIMQEWHPIKNQTLEPNKFIAGSNVKIWWKCDKGHEWQTAICHRTLRGNKCPKCRHKTEAKLLDFLKVRFPDVEVQFRPNWCRSPITARKLPFDFYIPSLNLLIELDGPQHFSQVSNWSCCENTRKKDVYKMKQAIAQGLSVVRLLQEEVFEASEEALLSNVLPHLVATDTPQFIYIVSEETEHIYDEHERLLGVGDTKYAESVESDLSGDDSEDDF